VSAGRVLVVGGGLAGSEAAWQLAEAGVDVELAEMRPVRPTPVHRGDLLAELVCSNSLRGDGPTNAVGVLKAEMEALDSLIIHTARRAAVPAGGALAVDREVFARGVTTAISEHPRITVDRREVEAVPEGPAIVATGPLTSPALHRALDSALGGEALSFYDAVAPIVAADSLDLDRLFRASRYGKGDGADYLNAPLDRRAYDDFVSALLAADKVPLKDFESEDIRYFEGCLPIEVMAERGRDTLRFGPMKPVGLEDPVTGLRPWAVVQLRQDDLAAEHWNLVGFQTKLTRKHPQVKLAGQITGVEGYVESAATGLLAARVLAAELAGLDPGAPPPETALGGLVRHLTQSNPDTFQPANINWGLMYPPPALRAVKNRRDRRLQHATFAVDASRRWAESIAGK
jgi:methylenetetrahydrofolate--tRNA-(uracil-5-)-methyltransferase